jgi:hypothetical protein
MLTWSAIRARSMSPATEANDWNRRLGMLGLLEP